MDSSVFFFSIVAVVICGLLVLLGKLRFHQDNKKQNSSSLSPPSSSSLPLFSLSRIWTQTYHVFPSFRGEDVRRDFLSHIQMEFQREGITLFIDNNIKRGEPIGPELLRAIRRSKIAIILLSENYASSNWCLDELVEIMKCREELGQTVIPIFYRVNPSDVRELTREFGKVFRKTCAGKTEEDIKRWKQALAEVGTLAGYHSSNWANEATMIKKIAKDIYNSTSSRYFNGLVRLRTYLVKLEPWLCLCSISRVAYNQLSSSFQLSLFMENVKAKYSRPCSNDYSAKLQLAPQFRSPITTIHKIMEIPHFGVAQDKLKDQIKVTLDDLEREGVLSARRAPATQDAFQIFCTYSFGQNLPCDGFEELAMEFTTFASGHPLAQRVMGSYFRGLCREEWIESLPKLRGLDGGIESILKFSYDALGEEDKDLFLHIACFLSHKFEIKRVEEQLAKFLDVRQRLMLLAKKSLVFINFDSGEILMDPLLAKFGREIVRSQRPQFLVSKL